MSLAKYVLLMSAAVGVAWAAVSVEIGGKTPYGHFHAAGGGAWMEAVRGGWLSARTAAVSQWEAFMAAEEAAEEDAPAAPANAPAPKPKKRRAAEPPSVQEEKGAERRVALLEAAQEAAAPEREKSKGKTRVDAPLSKGDRAALDRVVSGR